MATYLRCVLMLFILSVLVVATARKMITSSSDFPKTNLKKLYPFSSFMNTRKLQKLPVSKQKPLLKKIPSGISRVIRDLRFPFLSNTRPRGSSTLQQNPQHVQQPSRQFLRSTVRPVSLPEIKPVHHKQYRPAFPLTQSSALQQTQHGARVHMINKPSTSMHQTSNNNPSGPLRTTRGPLRLPGKDMLHRRPSPGRLIDLQRDSVKQNVAASVPVASLQTGPRHPTPNNNKRKENNYRHQSQSTRDRVIDVYHHIPITSSPHINIPKSPPVIVDLPSPHLDLRNSPEIETLLKEMEKPPPFISTGNGPPLFTKSSNFHPKRLPKLESPESDAFKTHLIQEIPSTINVYPRQPVNPSPNRPPSFTEMFQTESDYKQKLDDKKILDFQRNPSIKDTSNVNQPDVTDNKQDSNAPWNIDNEQSESIISAEKLAPVSDKLKYIRVLEETPGSNSTKIKKYWDFRQANFAEVPILQTQQQSLQKIVNALDKPVSGHEAKSYEGQEVISTLPVKEESPIEITEPGIGDQTVTIKPESSFKNNQKVSPILRDSHDSLYAKYAPIIKTKITTPFSHNIAHELLKNPLFEENISNFPRKHRMQGTETTQITKTPVNTISSTIINNLQSEITSTADAITLNLNKQLESNLQTKHGGSPLNWNENLGYIISDIFRQNASHFPEEIYTPELIEQPITSPGIYARNRGQFEKFVEPNLHLLKISDDTEDQMFEIKQYFRGPQHINHNNWTIFEDYPRPGSRLITSTFIPPGKPWVITPPTVRPFDSTSEGKRHSSFQQNRKINPSVQHTTKVFGRRNHTTRYTTISTTTRPEYRKHKFTYTPIQRNPLEGEKNSENKNGAVKLMFNFRTGSSEVKNINNLKPTHSSSVNQNTSLGSKIKTSEIPQRKVNQETRSHVPPKSFSESRNVYLNLKPVTKPYSSSTTKLPVSVVTQISSTENAGFATIIDLKSKMYAKQKNNDKIYSPEHLVIPSRNTKSETSTLSSLYTSVNSKIPLKTSEYDTYYTEQSKKPSTTEVVTSTINASNFPNNNLNQTNMNSFKTVTSKTSNLDDAVITTISSTSEVDVITQRLNQEQMIVDSIKSMKIKVQELMSKGIRHLMPSIMELFSDVTISSDCTFSLLRWLRGVKTMEQWAIKMIDASSKMPEGILYGTFSTFGSYDECVAIKTPKSNLQMSYRGQYCSIDIQPTLPENGRRFTIKNAFKKYPKLKQAFQEINMDESTMAYYYIMKHRMGVCIPSTCSLEDIGNVTDSLTKSMMMKISVAQCETSDRPSLTSGQIISMFGVFVAFGIVIIATVMDSFIQVRFEHEMDIDDIVRKKNSVRQFTYAFSAYRNSCKILSTSIPMDHLSSLYGIKFLSITWIMLGHVYYCQDYLTLAGLHKVRDLGSNFAFQVVLNSAFAADTFFVLSGLLVVYTTFQYLENNDGRFSIVGFYIRRYCRLTPAFIMISGVILLGPLAGSGPVWNETLEPFVSGCQNYWWTNLFYFSNFVPTAKTCVPHGWFLSCDMQFFIISPLIILALYRRPKLGLFLIGIGVIVSMLSTGFITFMYNLPPVSLFSLPHSRDVNEYLDTIGYKPYPHYVSYCVGMATGFLIAIKEKISISKCAQIFGWIFAVTTCTLVIYGTFDWNSGYLPDWTVSVAYATTSRFIWSVGISWLVIVCCSGCGGLVNDILSWKGFVPLSRLSFLAYLIHPLLMYLYSSYVRVPFYFSQYVVIYLYFGHLCITFGLAFLFSLAFELPILNLEKIVSKHLDQNKRKRRASFTHFHFNWQHPEHPEIKDSVVLMRRRTDRFIT